MQKSNSSQRKTNSKGGGRTAGSRTTPARATSSVRAVAAAGAEPAPPPSVGAGVGAGTPGLVALLSLSDELAAVTPLPAAERPAVPAHLATVALELAARSRWAPVAERLADMGPSLLPPGTVDRLERAAKATEHLLTVEPGVSRVAPGLQAEAEGIERRFKRLLAHYFEEDAEAKKAVGPVGAGYTRLGERITSMRAFLGAHEARLSRDEVAYRASDFERAPVVSAALAAAGASPVPAMRKAWEDELGRVVRVLLEAERPVRLALQHALALLPGGGSRLPRLRKAGGARPRGKATGTGEAGAKAAAKGQATATGSGGATSPSSAPVSAPVAPVSAPVAPVSAPVAPAPVVASGSAPAAAPVGAPVSGSGAVSAPVAPAPVSTPISTPVVAPVASAPVGASVPGPGAVPVPVASAPGSVAPASAPVVAPAAAPPAVAGPCPACVGDPGVA